MIAGWSRAISTSSAHLLCAAREERLSLRAAVTTREARNVLRQPIDSFIGNALLSSLLLDGNASTRWAWPVAQHPIECLSGNACLFRLSLPGMAVPREALCPAQRSAVNKRVHDGP
jgi:hypothetical protein